MHSWLGKANGLAYALIFRLSGAVAFGRGQDEWYTLLAMPLLCMVHFLFSKFLPDVDVDF